MISSKIARIVNSKMLNIEDDLPLKEIRIDSRNVGIGDLFIALKGKYKDGHDFIPQAIEKGARAVISEKPIDDTPCMVVESSQSALMKLANFHRIRFNIPIIAVCGSAGKTTTKEFIYSILRYHLGNVHRNFLNENNIIGVCKTLLGLKEHHRALVIELGSNTPGEIEMLSRIVRPTHAVITNIKGVHLEGFGNIDGVAKEKLSVLNLLGSEDTFVWNVDDNEMAKYIANNPINFKGNIVGFGTKDADFMLLSVKDSTIATKHKLWGIKEFTLPLKGSFNAMNALAALAATSCVCKLSPYLIQKAFSFFNKLPLRMEEKILHNTKFYLDCYNSNPDAVKAAIDSICDMENEFIVVLGDMMELGRKKALVYQEMGSYLAQKDNICFFIGFGDNMRYAVEKFRTYKDNALFFSKLEEVATFLIARNMAQIPVFVKGSRVMHMEKIVEMMG
ncbi:MAG: UDP-N-acetylmuramoyl-tripeptide--D-alanyl-D-alanine ligase [Campylobacterota bacterium]|nr:UDP-N-acetylmuramoyl-tripeptide--D-alanyl-D-alanine ligase [Campylobacterota bacterium]